MSVAYNPLSGNFETKEPGPQGPAGTVSAAGDGSQATPSISFASDTNTGLFRQGADSIGVSTGGTTRIVVDSSGRLGLGTTSPTDSAHISGSATTRLKVQSTGANTYPGVRLTNPSRSYDIQIDGPSSSLRIFDSSSSSERFRLDTAGRLLMGSSVAMHPHADNINVAGPSNVGLTLRCPNTAQGSIYFADGVSGDDRQRGKIVYGHSDNSLRLHANVGERVRIDSSGNLLLGGTLPSSPNISLNASGTASFAGDIETTTAATGVILKSPNGTRYRLTVANDGTLTTTAV